MDDPMIAPITEGWEHGERDWSFVKDPSSDIKRWEEESGRTLPDDYKRFMLAFNGGVPYPNVFTFAAPLTAYPSADPTTFIDPLNDWAMIEAEWNKKETYRNALPPNMLIIGADPGGLVVLMSVAEEESKHGKIFVWVARGEPWGDEDNNTVWQQAESFGTFMASLFDDADKTGWDHWHIPLFDTLAKPLTY